MSASYHFVTRWSFDAPVGAVWAELHAVERWPSWWRGVIEVTLLEPGDAHGLGSYRRTVWRSRLPYRLVFNVRTTTIDEPRVIEGVADGDLRGVGRWTLTPTARGTDVRYDWTVDATRWWMRLLGPAARGVFAWNHDVIMRWGHDGLVRQLRLAR